MRGKWHEWTYVNATLAAFVFGPEVHRLLTWHGNYDPLKLMLALPTLMLVPIAIFAYRKRAGLVGTGFAITATIWTCAFLYSFIVAVAFKSMSPGLYGLGLFLLPLVVGAWIVTSDGNLTSRFRTLSSALLLYGTVAGVYGVIQFVVAPPWDTSWMQSIAAQSFGLPAPFEIRVFSLMNGPGIYAEFTACCLILSLPNVGFSRPWSIVATCIMVVGLALSLVRTAWIAVIIGMIVFIVMSPRRWRAIGSLSAVALIFAIGAGAFFTFVPNDRVQLTLMNRINSLSGLSEDGSTVDREQTSQMALDSALAHPFGHGLGLTGEAAALRSNEAASLSDVPSVPIDNGLVSRFVEMGVPGLVGFLSAILFALFVTSGRLRTLRRSGCEEESGILAAALATEIAIALMTLSGDVYAGVGSVLFFLAFGLACKNTRVKASESTAAFTKFYGRKDKALAS